MDDPQYKTPDGAALRIWRDAAPNKFLSEQNGRPLFDEVIFVEIITPGSRDSTPVFEVERTFCEEAGRSDPKRTAKYEELKQFIEDFKRGETNDSSLAGTPLSQWPEMTRSMAATLKAANIFTLEALAALPDTKLSVVGPDGRTWREKAKAYVETAKNGAYATELAAKLEALIVEVGAGKQREADLAAQIAQLQAKAGQPATNAVIPDVLAATPATSKKKIEPPPAPVATGDEQLVAAKPPGDPDVLPII